MTTFQTAPTYVVEQRLEDAFHVLIIGEKSVGKTSIQKRILFDEFNENEQSSFSISSNFKTLTIDSQQVQIELQDTIAVNSEIFWLPDSIFKVTDFLMIVFDITQINSLLDSIDWYHKNKNMFKNDICLMLIGNKFDSGADSDEYRLMTQVAEENDAEFISASAKNNQSIEKITNRLAFYALEHNKRQQSKATVTPVGVPQPITSYEANQSFESEPRRSLYKSKVEESKYQNYEGGEREEGIDEDDLESEDLFRTRSLLKDSITIRSLLAKSRIEETYGTQAFVKDLIEVLDNEENLHIPNEEDIFKTFL